MGSLLRNFLNNVVDIDAAGRIYSTKYNGSEQFMKNLVNNYPAIAAFDYSAAFTSLIQDWVWLVLAHRKLPQSFITLLRALYHRACAVYKYNGIKYVIIRYLSGVLQGCPSAGWLFNSALDPFLCVFSKQMDKGRVGTVRACADDLSFALSRLKHLILLYPIYASACKHAGLELHPKKCVLVPLIALNEHNSSTPINATTDIPTNKLTLDSCSKTTLGQDGCSRTSAHGKPLWSHCALETTVPKPLAPMEEGKQQ